MSLPRKVQAVIFDMDGLLIDSEVVHTGALIAQAAHMGHELPLAVVKRMIGHSWAGSVFAQVLTDHFGPKFDTALLRAGSTERFYELAKVELALKTGVLEILDHLDSIGLPRAVCTSSQRIDAEHHLGAHDLMGRFQAILTHGDYARSKPHPDPYLKAAEVLGFAPQDCLALEDSHNGVRAASSAGMMTIMVPDMLDPTEEMHSLCVRIARDLHEVRELLQAQTL